MRCAVSVVLCSLCVAWCLTDVHVSLGLCCVLRDVLCAVMTCGTGVTYIVSRVACCLFVSMLRLVVRVCWIVCFVRCSIYVMCCVLHGV